MLYYLDKSAKMCYIKQFFYNLVTVVVGAIYLFRGVQHLKRRINMKSVILLLIGTTLGCTAHHPQTPHFSPPHWNGFFLYNKKTPTVIHYILTEFENGSPRIVTSDNGIICGDIDELDSSVCFTTLRNPDRQWVLTIDKGGEVLATQLQENGCTLVYQAKIFHQNYTAKQISGTLYVVKAALPWFERERSTCTQGTVR